MKEIDYYRICEKKLKYLNYSESTITTYTHVSKFTLLNINTPI